MLRSRVRELSALCRMMRETETLLRFQALEFPELFARLRRTGAFASLPLLDECGRRLSDGERLADAWEAAVTDATRRSALDNGDRAALLDFGNGLGATDLEGQLNHVRLHRELLSDRLRVAEENAEARGKVYITLGICAGVGLCMLLI